jgi:hypothetical protein
VTQPHAADDFPMVIRRALIIVPRIRCRAWGKTLCALDFLSRAYRALDRRGTVRKYLKFLPAILGSGPKTEELASG